MSQPPEHLKTVIRERALRGERVVMGRAGLCELFDTPLENVMRGRLAAWCGYEGLAWTNTDHLYTIYKRRKEDLML